MGRVFWEGPPSRRVASSLKPNISAHVDGEFAPQEAGRKRADRRWVQKQCPPDKPRGRRLRSRGRHRRAGQRHGGHLWRRRVQERNGGRNEKGRRRTVRIAERAWWTVSRNANGRARGNAQCLDSGVQGSEGLSDNPLQPATARHWTTRRRRYD